MPKIPATGLRSLVNPWMYNDTWTYRFYARHPILWRNMQLVRYRHSRELGQIVSPDHHLVLEGFPRSGNSFSVRAFLYANGARRTWSIAHHFHKLPQVVLGVRWKLPTIVVMRPPEGAVQSLLAHSIDKGMLPAGDKDLHCNSFSVLFRHWQHFYESVYLMRNDIVLSDFSATTKRFDLVIEAANARFNCGFSTKGLSEAQTSQEIFQTGGAHLSPNAERDTIKQELRELIGHPSVQEARDSARRAYDKACEYAVTA